MTFSPHELSRLALLRNQAADSRALSGELTLATDHLPQLAEIERNAQEALSCALPSQILADHPAVVDARQRHNDAVVKRADLGEAQSRVQTRLAGVTAQLKRECSETIQSLRQKLKAGTPRAVSLDELLNELRGEPADQADALIKFSIQLGAVLPGTNPAQS